MKYLLSILLAVPLFSQQTFTEAEVLNILKERDAQWEGKIEKADSLISSQKILIVDHEGLVEKLEHQAKIDSLLLNAKDKQIVLLKAREDMNEKMAKLVTPKWYEHRYLWFVMGAVPSYIVGKIVGSI